ncbi:ribonuclease H-like domain-containing protein, partial [Tanacetum coccineum]
NQENKGRENNTRTITVETPTQNALIAQDGIGGYDWSYQAEEENPTNFALMAYTSSGSSSSSDSEVDSCSKTCVKAYATLKEQYDNLSSDYNKLRDNALVENKKKLEKAEKEKDELEKFQNSSKSLNSLLESQVSDRFKTGLGYNATTAASPAVESFVNSSEMLENQECNRPKGYHAVPLPYTGNFIPRKPDLTYMDEIVKILTRSGKLSNAGATVNTVRPVNTANKKAVNTVTSVNTANIKAVNTVKQVNIAASKSIETSDILMNMKTMMVDLFPLVMVKAKFLEKNNVLFTDTGYLVLSSDFKLLDESQVLLRVPKKDNIYSVDLKSVVLTRCLTCLIAKATIDKSNTWHRRLGHINFKTMNKLVERCDNGTEFKNSIMNQFCEIKGIKREFSVARTPQQNGVAERKNRTLIEAARTMLVDSKLPTTFWAEAVNTACYVLNRVLVIKPHNKTPYELIRGRPPLIDFMKPFGCPVTILNTRDHLGKFDGKADEGYFVGYYVVSKAMRVFNKRTMIVEETLNIRFLENTPNVKGNGPDWLFDVDSLTISMNYVPVVAGNQTNGIAGTKDNIVAGHAQKEKEPEQEYILIPLSALTGSLILGPKDSEGDAGMKPTEVDER